ncbi:MAG TPA: exonuclease subunit SbcD [Novosphingobium capsulatum]|nr:exonuclease subunit SbcD [Novosphingobium capsulatum]
MSPLTLLHTSDWHLGHELNGHPREEEHRHFLDWLHAAIGEHGVDALVVTGDIYDVANPPVSAMARLYGFLHRLCAAYPALDIVILGGNHDSAMRIDLPGALLGTGRVHFAGAMPRTNGPHTNGAPDPAKTLIPLTNGDGAIAAWLAAVPFCRPVDLGRESLETLYAAVQDAGLARAGDLPLVVTGHLHVAGGAVSEMSERRIVVGGEEAQAPALFDARAAYVALGHLHRAQAITGPTTIRYAGSPFPLSMAERDYRHSVALVRLAAAEPETPPSCTVELLPIPRPVVFHSLGPLPLDEAVAAIGALDLDADLPPAQWPFIEVSVAVTGPEPLLHQKVLAALADRPLRLVRLRRHFMAQGEQLETGAEPVDLDDLDPAAVFARLYADQHEGEAPPEDLAQAFARLMIDTQTTQEPR